MAASKSKRKSSRGRGKKKGQRTRLLERVRMLFFGGEVEETTADRLREILGLVFLGFALLLFLSMVSFYTPYQGAEGYNWCGQAGFYLARWVFTFVGWSGYSLAALSAAWGVVLITRRYVDLPALRVFGTLCFLVSSAFLLELAFGTGDAVVNERLPYGPGGYFALELIRGSADVSPVLVEKFGVPGLWLVLSLTTLISFMLATEMAFYPAFLALAEWRAESRDDEEGLGAAVFGWMRNLGVGLWDFLRGADLQPDGLLIPAKAKTKASKAKKKAAAKKTPAKKKAAKKPEPVAAEEDDEEEEWEEDDELAGEGEDGEEWEWVYDDAAEDDEEEDEDDEEEWEEDDEGEWEEEDDEWEEEEEPAPVPAPKKPARKPVQMNQAPLVFDPPTPPPGPWKFPPLDMLEAPVGSSGEDSDNVEAAARKLENALTSFRVESGVVGAKVGPAVTMFELEVSQGTRMNKVTALSQEIAAALRAKSVRIIAPIPGRSTIGIEVPNGKRRVVRLSELISQQAYDPKFAALPLFLGMDAEGTAIVADLARMPHLLIAGTTGSGKSVCINTILASLLLTRSPHDVQLILVDPKMVELQMFAKVPHLMLPVVTDMQQATNVLNWAVEKMEGRYDLFKNAGVKNIKGYNSLGEEKLKERMGDEWNEERTPRHVPYIVVVIDEMADLMMTSKKEAEMTITRLAQKSRAVGIHVIVATQRPSTDVITGVLKGNLPTRIAFQVASKIDSRVILDASGAEKLLGQGDMLYTPPQSSQVLRVQGALVEDHELQSIVDFVCDESAPTFSQELIQAATGSSGPGKPGSGDGPSDPMWDDAVRVILKSRRGSASLLQRALGVGYTRASRLIDLMTSEGIVGDYKGSKAREVLMSLEDWEEMHGAATGSGASHDDEV